MSHRLEKNMRILDELVGFMCRRGARDIDINIKFGLHTSFLTVEADVDAIDENSLETLTEALNADRQHEVEECYWLLNGDDSFGDELSLTGIMIDDATITYENSHIKIVARRVEQRDKH
ncbi:MAG: hypothetical protein ACK5LT_12520 [Lachnospirales bacterium]